MVIIYISYKKTHYIILLPGIDTTDNDIIPKPDQNNKISI